jgi:D-xylose transport system ATP-binding protein
MDSYLLELKGVTKIFPGVKALSSVSLGVLPSEIHGICGENGAGKSTLIKILSGVYPHGTFTGSILLEGREQVFHNPADAERSGIATIYQELALFKKLSIAENIFMGRAPSRLGVIQLEKVYAETRRWLAEVGMAVSPEEKVEHLGIAQQQLVEVAKALSKSARVLILDEPTSALAEHEVGMLMEILRNLKKKGVTCIYISHKLSEIIEIADRITVLRDGEHIGTDLKSNLDVKKLIFMMVGRNLESMYPKEQFQRGKATLEVKNLNVYDPEQPRERIIKDVSFTAYASEILGVAGLMGSGRTELASAIFGINASYRTGQIIVCGNAVQINNPMQAIENGLVYLPEDRKRHGLVLPMSVKENTTLASLGKMARLFINESREINLTNKYIRELGIKTPSVETAVSTLSGGNQQKVVLGKWLMTEPAILLLDEVTRGIDVGAKYEIYKIMNVLVRTGVTLIMISSELPEILGMCDRILVMHEGSITGEFLAKEATQELIMQYATMELEDKYHVN